MRLTLRTLLAYLDDILPPAEAKALGEKIAASPIATQYVERIRDVMRRRRLTAPDLDGSGGGIEPNLVAEYLDNSLAPEMVADVERVCLESDINLAEVAACHQILTLVLGEPVEISGRLRERMYALGPQAASIEVPANGRGGDMSAREQLAAIQHAQRPKPAPATKSLESRLPDYLKPKPLWKRVLPWAAIAAVVLLWLGVLAYDPTFFGGRVAQNRADDAATTDDVDAPPEANADGDEPAPPAVAVMPDEGANAEVADDAAPSVAAVDRAELPVDPEPPSDDQPIMVDRPDREDGDAAPAVVAASDASDAAEDMPAPMPVASAQDDAPTVVVEPTTPPTVQIASTTGTVLRLDAAAGQWFPMAEDDVSGVGSGIAVPDPFEADVDVGGFPLKTTVLGGTRFATFGATDAGPLGFDIAQGRLRLQADPAAAVKPAEMMFALRLGKSLFRVEPLTPDAVFGIEVLPLQPTGVDQDLSGRTPQGVVYVGAGTVRLADASGRIAVASTGNRLILVPDGTGSIGVPAGGGAPQAAEGTPAPAADEISPVEAENDADVETLIEPETTEPVELETVNPADRAAEPINSGRGLPLPAAASPAADATNADTDREEPVTDEAAAPAPDDAASGDSHKPTIAVGLPEWLTPQDPTPAARRAMAAFNDEFVTGAPAGESLLPAVDSPLYYVAEPAAKALGLIEDVDGMVKTLRDTEHREATIAAIEGIRNWLGRSPDRGPALKRQLNLVYPRQGLADILLRLAWGYDRDDARDEATARELVELLDHNDRVVREMAFYHVHRLSGRTMFYRPNQSSTDRAGAMTRWREFVNRYGGLVAQ